MSFPTDTQLKAMCIAAKVIQTATYPANAIIAAFKTTTATEATAKELLDTEYAAVVNRERNAVQNVQNKCSPYRMQFKRVFVN